MRVITIAVLVAAAIAVACAARPHWSALEGYTFEQYVQDFGKNYVAGTEEYRQREANFNAYMREAKLHNAGTKTWKKGVDHMSDWTNEEFLAINRAYPSSNKFLKASPNAQQYKVKGIALPKTVDYRTSVPAVLTEVKNQGRCGSCWAHAAVECVESMWAIATGQLFALSQQQLTSCTPNPNECGGKGGCHGAIPELAWDYVVAAGGMAEEWAYPYTSYYGDDGVCKPNNETRKYAKLSGYMKVPENDASAVMEALFTAGPVSISVDASPWRGYAGGVFTGCDYAKNISMNHAVQLVGYGYDSAVKLDYWIVRNSWSPAWGENGYIRMERAKMNPCGWNVNPQNGVACKNETAPQWTCGICGLAYDVVYPIVAV